MKKPKPSPAKKGGGFRKMPIKSAPVAVRRPTSGPAISPHKPSSNSWWRENPKYTILLVTLLLALAVGVGLGVPGVLGKFSSSSSSTPLTVVTPPSNFIAVGSVFTWASPYLGVENYTNSPVPPVTVSQPWSMTFSTQLAGCGIASTGSAYDPPLPIGPAAVPAPDGVQYGFCQPAHDNTVAMYTQLGPMTQGATYTVAFYYAQRRTAPTESPPVSNFTLASTTIITLDSTTIATLSVGATLTGTWQPYTTSNAFTWSSATVYPILAISATGPAGTSGTGEDVSVLFDEFSVSLA